ncbi:hypothetical protein H2O64_18460 [Kordia sp. YSTF-M3]|uniref:Bacteriocin n=1 Tax=Kordia aestuariivivens TaxID=2759037 RepID=A0ABR7QDK1_9FLAO|nr:hypothetical protein [Kordia aestuariivivens]MBC8756662.1 hypothetical protein [Kordia aestuariivivens]
MLKKILIITGTKTLSKAEQTEILGGGLSSDPISGGGGGSGGGGTNDPMPCFCIIFGQANLVPCNSTCPDGTQPFCP